jgi:hypothetical protein
LWLFKPHRFTENYAEKTGPALNKGGMCTPEPPFIGKGHASWANGALTIFTNHYRFRSGYCRADGS